MAVTPALAEANYLDFAISSANSRLFFLTVLSINLPLL